MVRKMLVKMLYRLGSDVHEVQDGQDAIDNVKEKLLMKSEEEPSSEVEGGGERGCEDKPMGGATVMMPYDLILMDSNMPRVSGPEATEVIVRHLGFINPVVGVTGSVLPSDVTGA